MTPACVQAIKDRAATFTTCPIYWPNEQIAEPETNGVITPYIWAEITGLSSDIRSMAVAGSHWIRDEGFIRFHIVVPSGTTTDTAYSLGETLAAIFRIVNFSGVQTLAPLPTDAGVYDGKWFTSSFSVPFYFDYQG